MFQILIVGIVIGATGILIVQFFLDHSKFSNKYIQRLTKKGIDNYTNNIEDLANLYNNVVSNLNDEVIIKRVVCDHVLMKLGKMQSNLLKTDARIVDANKKEIDEILRKVGIMIETISDTLSNIRDSE